MELPAELRLQIYEAVLCAEIDDKVPRSYGDLCLHFPSHICYCCCSDKRTISKIGLFKTSKQIRVEVLVEFFRQYELKVDETGQLPNLRRWISAGNTELRLEDLVRKLRVDIDAIVYNEPLFTNFVLKCMELRSLIVEFWGKYIVFHSDAPGETISKITTAVG